ncbi:MAG: GGDEF domain-containing protein [Vampirovibrionia bacterium]
MRKSISLIERIIYLSLCILVLLRVLFKAYGYSLYNFKHKDFLNTVYNITNTIVSPIEKICNEISIHLPIAIQKIFPVLSIKETHGILEWHSIITIGAIILIGVTIERYINRAFKTHKKPKDHSKRSLERLTNETNMQKEHDSSLKEAYNIIIKRLDREKTELVNKNISLEKEIITDTLTGLKTRKYMDERLKYEFNNAKTRKSSLSIILLDIDHFKLINDNLGHQIGDQVLKDVSNIIINSCGKNIVAARYGGEEILVIAPKTNEEDAHKLAECIRNKIQTTLKYGKNKETEVTISAGIVTYTGSNEKITINQLIEKADTALYNAKNAGRNRSMVYNN